MANDTPPPENTEGYAYPESPENGNGPTSSSLGPAAPAVAAAPGRVLIVLLVAVVGIGFILYSLFSGDDNAPPTPTIKPTKLAVAPPTSMPPMEAPPSPPELPLTSPTPPITSPTAMSSTVAPPPLPPIEPPSIAEGPSDEARVKRIKSPMLALDGGSKLSRAIDPDKVKASTALNNNNPNQAFADNLSKSSQAEQVVAGQIGNLHYMIAQGKIIEAVLETAINSDLPGQIRAIVSRDIFAESGKLVLVPKGSRLIGTYNPSILRGQERVFIVWTRLIRPDGIDVMIDSPATDALGRAGMSGYVDNKYMATYASAFLTSLVDVGVAYGGEKLVGGNVTQTNNTDGSSSQSGSSGAIALQGAVGNIGDVSRSITGGLLDLRPTITIDQGTRINVFVNKDLIFPPEILERGKIIQ